MVKLRDALKGDLGVDPVLGEISLKGNKDAPSESDVRTKVTSGQVAFDKYESAAWNPADIATGSSTIGGDLTVNDGTRDRLTVGATALVGLSPDGTKSITINDDGVATVGRHIAEFHLTSTVVDLAINDDGVTWTKIPGMVGNLLRGFSVTGGTMTKTLSGATFLVNGVSDLDINKAATISYGLAINGSVVPHEVTTHTFTSASKIENISITALAAISENDTIEIWAKGDGTAGILLTINKLDVTFWGE